MQGLESFPTSRTVLVTGASGFLGTRLVRRLVAEGLIVRGTHRRAQPPEVAGAQWWPLTELDSFSQLLAAVTGVDVVVHLAALAHQPGRAGVDRWREFERLNVEATRLLARASSRARVQRLIFMSSVGAVCSHSDTPVDEQTACMPEDDYGRSKLAAECALAEELQGSETDWCIVRAPLVYGPGNPGNMRRLLRLVAAGLPLPFGAIRNRRSFIFVDNLIDAVVTVLRHRGSIRTTYLLSDGSDFSTPELVASLADAAGRPVRMISVPIGALRLLGLAGDLVNRIRGTPTGFDSYSVDRLVGSLPVNGSRFTNAFRWSPPVERTRAIALTSQALIDEPRES